MLENIDGFVIDLDGTVYKGKDAIEGAMDTIAYLKSIGKRIAFLSNRGNISRKMCHDKLIGMGIDVEENEILLTSTVTANYLRENDENCQAWVLGEQGLRDELEIAGIKLADKPELADWLVITLHETLTYKELNEAFRAVRHGARIIATNEDKTFPGDGGDCIDVAGMIGAIEASTDQKVEVVIGKPSSLMAEAAFRAIGLPAERCIMIGDSLVSDIGLGKNAGMMTALVLTGSVNREAVEASNVTPDLIWDSLADLKRILESE
ncbi:HAD-IIA family hydrolase [Paenibacillus crassostreae]|uniref:Acid sugar phosphatase n=1 Tax=Paenibacillus crassostreae TaxID=1763538 RepID=A0A167BX03_9BACL|nr:HAD-IIA family hydrolase [Paenibacillus crassostreae]AOZ92589.1 haloacid dehalogenase [Paenibacillus crassostreae]OAB72539.1 haloacid dehalogenase [Paenibacillus crassostreae]